MKAMKAMKTKREASANQIIGLCRFDYGVLNCRGEKRQQGNDGPQGKFTETDPIAT